MIRQSHLEHALDLFNRARFFEAHEALEDLWREQPVTSLGRKHFQGLVQIAVALHHESQGNLRGARSVLDRALRNLAGAEETFPDLDIEGLKLALAEWQEYLMGGGTRPPLPRITKNK